MPTLFGAGRAGSMSEPEGEFEEAIKTAIAETQQFYTN